MKKYILSLCTLIAASSMLLATPEQLTLLKGSKTVATINVEDIDNISYQGNKSGYTQMNVTMKDKTIKSFSLSSFNTIEYIPELDDFRAIIESYDDHCEVIVLDHYYNDSSDYANHYHKCLPGEAVHYYYTVEPGYDVEVSIIGNSTGHNYRNDRDFEFEDDYTGTGSVISSTAFLMPNEAITIKAVSTERNTYKDAPFIGLYPYGFWINEKYDNHVYSTSNSMAEVNIRSNGVFEVKSLDSNNYDFKGTFNYNVASNSFTYNAEDCKTYGLEGRIISEDFILGIVKNILVDRPENTHFYWISKKPLSFVRATGNDLDRKYIIELGNNNDKQYYFIDTPTYALHEAKATFSEGTTLSDKCIAILEYDARPYAIKYTLQSKTSKPVIEYAGDERGLYNEQDHMNGDQLWLDGFKNGKYGDIEGSYTISGIEVTFTPDNGSENIIFHINSSTKLYTRIENNSGWNGPLRFSTNFTGGKIDAFNQYNSGESIMEIWLDHNYSGSVEEGKAKFTMKAGGASMIDSTVPYVYNSSTNTITLNCSYVYFGNDWIEDEALVLKVSNDKRSLTLDYAYISTFAAKGYAWIVGANTVLAAEEN